MNNEDKEIRQLVSFFDSIDDLVKSRPAIGYIEHDVNGPKRFAIQKSTMGGKYMRGNLLYYSFNGIEIYTEPTNVIFVDLINNTLFIKDIEKIQRDINPTNPEQKEYIMLYTDIGFENAEEEFPLRWESVVGRTTAYENIKLNAPVIDIDKSLILTETVPLKDALTVREFVNYLQNSDFVDDELFNINDYSGSEYI